MASGHKKAILRSFDGTLAWGYLPQTGLLQPSEICLMEVDGKIKYLPLNDIKTIAYVKDFNLNDPHDPERLGRKTFLSRPRGDGLWIKLVLRDGDSIEGLSSFDLTLLDSLIADHGLWITPPDARSNTQRLFLPRPAIRSLEVLGLILSSARRSAAQKTSSADLSGQPGLFADPDPSREGGG